MMNMVWTNGIIEAFVQYRGWKINLQDSSSNESSIIVPEQNISHQLKNIPMLRGNAYITVAVMNVVLYTMLKGKSGFVPADADHD